MNGRYMMATRAEHKLGDISRDKPDLAWIREEHDSHYTGEWVTGFGFNEVRFPKSTTRDLTDAEREQFEGQHLAMGDRLLGQIRLDEPR